jgi:hypothetical protein
VKVEGDGWGEDDEEIWDSVATIEEAINYYWHRVIRYIVEKSKRHDWGKDWEIVGWQMYKKIKWACKHIHDKDVKRKKYAMKIIRLGVVFALEKGLQIPKCALEASLRWACKHLKDKDMVKRKLALKIVKVAKNKGLP